MNYRIDQAYVSESVGDFDWYNRFNLKPYYDSSKPCIFIGMYRDEDKEALKQHRSHAVVKWTGYDSVMNKTWKIFKSDHIKNISVHPNVVRMLHKKKIKCDLINPYVLDPNIYQGISGNKIYAYCPETSNDYHRSDLIKKVKKSHQVLIGKSKYDQIKWHSGIKYDIYNQCYIGMVLNNHAGGLASILELAMQGKYCITNVAKQWNCLSWKTFDDILDHLKNPKYKQTNEELAKSVDFYNFTPDWLNIDL